MNGESILETEKSLPTQKQNRDDSVVIFKIIDGIKDILEEDHKQKQPLFLSIDEKLLIKYVKEFLNNQNKQFLIGIRIQL